MTGVIAILEQLRELGVTTTIAEDKLQLRPGSKVPSDLADALRANKIAILEHFRFVQEDVEGLLSWAAEDPKRWTQVLSALKRGWDLARGGDSPRDILVRWASAHQRLSAAKRELEGLKSRQGALTVAEQGAIGGREADISFFSRFTAALDRRAVTALALDEGVGRKLSALLKNIGSSGNSRAPQK